MEKQNICWQKGGEERKEKYENKTLLHLDGVLEKADGMVQARVHTSHFKTPRIYFSNKSEKCGNDNKKHQRKKRKISKVISRFNKKPFKIPIMFSVEIEKSILKFLWDRPQGSTNRQNNPENEQRQRSHTS